MSAVARHPSRALAGACLGFLAYGSAAMGAPTPPQGPSLSEDQAVGLALEHSYRQRAWAARRSAANARVDLATAWNDPELRLTGLPIGRQQAASSGPTGRRLDRLDLSLRWSPPQPGVGSNLGDAALARADATGLQGKRSQQSLDASVRKLHLRLLGAQDLVKLSRQALSVRDRLLDAAQRQAEAGARTGLEHSLAKLDRWETQARLESDDAQVAMLWLRLASFTQIDPNKAPSLSSERLAGPCSLPGQGLEAQLRGALRQRSDLQAARRSQDATAHRLQAARWQRLPWIRFGEIGYRFEDEAALDFIHMGLAFDLPLSGAHGANVERWVAQRSLADAERADLERQVKREVEEAWIALVRRVATLKSFEQGAVALDEALSHVSRALDSGSIDLLALTSVEGRQARARRAWSQALISCHLANIDLAFAAGQPLSPEAGKKTASLP